MQRCNLCRKRLDYHGRVMGFQFCDPCWHKVLRGLRQESMKQIPQRPIIGGGKAA